MVDCSIFKTTHTFLKWWTVPFSLHIIQCHKSCTRNLFQLESFFSNCLFEYCLVVPRVSFILLSENTTHIMYNEFVNVTEKSNGEACTNVDQCMASNAVCSTTCQCSSGHYLVGSACLTRKYSEP